MIDHIAVGLSELGSPEVFFRAVLAAIGAGWLVQLPPALTGIAQGHPNRSAVHVASRLSERAPVQAFQAAALPARGCEPGAPAAPRARLPRFRAPSGQSQHRGVP
jgi:hypothetical protein